MLNCVKYIAYTVVIVCKGLAVAVFVDFIKSIIIMYCETEIKAIVYGDLI